MQPFDTCAGDPWASQIVVLDSGVTPVAVFAVYIVASRRVDLLIIVAAGEFED